MRSVPASRNFAVPSPPAARIWLPLGEYRTDRMEPLDGFDRETC